MEQFSRLEILIGEDKLELIKNKRIAIFGIGGVGGAVVEALVRSGITKFDLIDNDIVSISNLNRQIIANLDTIGKYKVDVMKDRILSINKNAEVNVYKCFFLPENSNEFDFSQYDYVVDAVDTVTAKTEIIRKSKESKIPVISSMGTGNKMNPIMLEVSDIHKTSVCPLAKVMRYELRKRNIKDVKVVYSKEEPLTPKKIISDDKKRNIPGSTSFVPPVAGYIIASEIIKDIIENY